MSFRIRYVKKDGYEQSARTYRVGDRTFSILVYKDPHCFEIIDANSGDRIFTDNAKTSLSAKKNAKTQLVNLGYAFEAESRDSKEDSVQGT